MSKAPLKTLTFSVESLQHCLSQPPPKGWFEDFPVPDDGSWEVLRQEVRGHCFILDENAVRATGRVVVSLGKSGFFGRLSEAGLVPALQRIHRLAIQFGKRQRTLPVSWSQYSTHDLVTVFAYPSGYGSERIIAQVSGADVFLCAVTTDKDRVDLEVFEPESGLFREATALYSETAAEVSSKLRNRTRKPTFQGVIDLEAIGAGAVTGGRTYGGWLPLLSGDQKRFIEAPTNKSLKLRGPAGSGKTLAMELKVLRECYLAADKHADLRVLYVTHSWSVAEQVQSALDQLDERQVLDRVDVFPLITLAQQEVERTGKLRVLGDDSYTGKEAQLRTLAELLSTALRSDWLAFRSSCSDSFIDRVESAPGSSEANRLLWDLMLESACVIGANGILPGINAERRYKQIERRPWMMPLATEGEKSFVLLIYSRMVGDLLGKDEMTTDQVINDYLNLLSTYRWHSERRRRGYDLIFVDEFHLFNEQERMVFHHLSRDPENNPVLFMAMDPRQSPTETYAEFAVAETTIRESGVADKTLGDYSSIDLGVVYRYTPEILRFLQFLDKYFPALDLGADWGVSVSTATSARYSGEPPQFISHKDAAMECQAALDDAVELNVEGKTVAVLCLDSDAFARYRSASTVRDDAKFKVVESRDDADGLRYTKRSIVISQPHYVAGLQFDAVVVGGCRPEFSQYDPYQAYGLRRFLSDLYLASSRARDTLHIHASGVAGEFPPVIKSSLEDGALVAGS